MKYRELIEKYQKGILEDALKHQVEEDIEKQEAISEFLFERDMEEPMGESLELPSQEPSEEQKMSEAFTKEINASIRRAFRKMGIIVAAAVLALVLFFGVGLPKIVDQFFYNPAASVGKDSQQIGIDYAVGSELLMPFNRISASAESKGYGAYDISLGQTFSRGDVPVVDTAGTIVRNEMKLYNSSGLVHYANSFEWTAGFDYDTNLSIEKNLKKQAKSLKEDGVESRGAGGTKKESLQAIRELPDGSTTYRAYISLNHILPYKKVAKMFDGGWYAVQIEEGNIHVDIGLDDSNPGNGVSIPKAMKKKYPMLDGDSIQDTYKGDSSDWGMTEKVATQHFLSMLRYMGDNEQFWEMMGTGYVLDVETAEAYIKKNGLRIHGVADVLNKEEMLDLMKNPEVYSIYVNTHNDR